jgi:hypothetical protein
MKTASIPAVAAVAVCLGGPALALDFGNGFSLVGDVELEYVSASGADQTYGYADLTLGWRSQGSGAVGFGFDLAFVGVEASDSNDSINAFWGGLVLTTSFGEFTVGNPRPLLKTMIVSPIVGGVGIFDRELALLTGSTLDVLVLISSDVDSYGVSFKGGSGDLSYGASYHKLEQGSFSADVVELAMTYQLGKTLIQGGAEFIDADSTNRQKLLLGATYVEDRWSVGALLTSSAQGSSDINSLKLWGDYSIAEAFTIGAQVQTLDTSSSQTFYGLTGEYGFGSGGFAELGMFDSDVSGSDTVYQASIGYRF